jgi:hypothetical protein
MKTEDIYTVAQLQDALKARGVPFKAKARKSELAALFEAFQRSPRRLDYQSRLKNYQRQNGHDKLTTAQARQLYKSVKRELKREMERTQH